MSANNFPRFFKGHKTGAVYRIDAKGLWFFSKNNLEFRRSQVFENSREFLKQGSDYIPITKRQALALLKKEGE